MPSTVATVKSMFEAKSMATGAHRTAVAHQCSRGPATTPPAADGDKTVGKTPIYPQLAFIVNLLARLRHRPCN